MKKKLMTSALTLSLVFGVVAKAAANPMFAIAEEHPGECFAGVRPIYGETYVFWIKVHSEIVRHEAC